MKPLDKRVSSSPLIDPTACSFVVIAPNGRDLASVSPRVRNNLQRNLVALTAAAGIMSVPVFVASSGPQAGKHGLTEQLSLASSHREFTSEEHASPWLNPAFVETLAAQDRSILVLAGFWLEHEVLATALHALADSYDVYIVFDATPARTQNAARFSRERLMQAGGTPVVTSQVIHEWSLEAADVSGRAALCSLLAPLIED